MARTISKSLDAFEGWRRMRGMSAPKAGHRFEGVYDPFLARIKAY